MSAKKHQQTESSKEEINNTENIISFNEDVYLIITISNYPIRK